MWKTKTSPSLAASRSAHLVSVFGFRVYLGIQPREKSLRSSFTGLYPEVTPVILHGVVSPEFKVWGLGFRVQGLGFRVQGSGFRFVVSGFRVQGSGFRVLGVGCRVERTCRRSPGPCSA